MMNGDGKMDNDVNRFDRKITEMIEDRGQDQPDLLKEIEKKPKIEPLPISEKQYIACASILASQAIINSDPKKCREYFNLKRRAVFGNRYSEIAGMEDIERQMWEMGTGEKAVENGRKR